MYKCSFHEFAEVFHSQRLPGFLLTDAGFSDYHEGTISPLVAAPPPSLSWATEWKPNGIASLLTGNQSEFPAILFNISRRSSIVLLAAAGGGAALAALMLMQTVEMKTTEVENERRSRGGGAAGGVNSFAFQRRLRLLVERMNGSANDHVYF